MIRGEVRDIGGTGVGTAVYRRNDLAEVVRWIGTATREPWAGPWRIIDEDANVTLMEYPRQDSNLHTAV